MYESVKKFVESAKIDPDSTVPQIKLNTRTGKATCYSPEEFNNVYREYIDRKITTENLATDQYNQLQCLRAENVLYLDGDWHFTQQVDEDNYEYYTRKLMNDYLVAWLDVLENYNLRSYYFPFIPAEMSSKGGFHVYIVCDKPVTQEYRQQIYNDVKRRIQEKIVEEFTGLLDIDPVNEYSKLFDYGPIKSMQFLLPFAQKDKSARHYILTQGEPAGQYQPGQYDWFVFGVKHYENQSVDQKFHVHVSNEYSPEVEKAVRKCLRREPGAKLPPIAPIAVTNSDASVDEPVESVDTEVKDNLEDQGAEWLGTSEELPTQSPQQPPRRKPIPTSPNAKAYAEALAEMQEKEKQEKIRNEKLKKLEKRAAKETTIVEELIATGSFDGTKSFDEDLIDLDESGLTDQEVKECSNYILNEADTSFIDSLFDKAATQTDYIPKMGISCRIIANYLLSLEYLSPNHPFWKVMADNDLRLRHVISPVIQFMFVNQFIERRGDVISADPFIHTVTRMLLPLLELTNRYYPKQDTQRATYTSCYQHVKNYYDKYSGISTGFTPAVTQFWINYCKLSAKEKKQLGQKDGFQLKKVLILFSKFFRGWAIFTTKLILGGITDEITPFRMRSNPADNPRLRGDGTPVTFDDVIRENANTARELILDDSFYIRTLRQWTVMFLVVSYYNNQSSVEAIRAVLTAFTRRFIWCNKSISGDSKLYIYNIRQTKALCAYPYNQWLLDNTPNADFLKSWFKSIYLQVVAPELQTIDASVHIKPLLKNLEMTQLITDDRGGLKPLANFDRDMESMFRNILATFDQECWSPPKELDPVFAEWFPMRNGLLEFHHVDTVDHKRGTYTMHYDNRDRYMTVYSNIIYQEDYDYTCEAFQKVQKMFEQIFPREDEREYVMTIFSSVLTGGITKDLLLIPYGTGGDGKTISNNAMLGMLGSDGLTSHIPIMEFGRREYIKNPAGMGTTMKTQALLMTKDGSHDSGGIVQLANKRFCTVQEPDPNMSNGKLNCANIKEILSGTTITAREIYKKAEAFTVNAIITLQTNILLAYSEDTDAIRRRITVIPYRSKFTTSINEDKYGNLEHKFKADPQLSTALVNNPDYWQALFYLFLPYCQKLIATGVKALSDVKRPQSIKSATDDSFTRSSGLVGWFNQNMRKVDGWAVSMVDIVKKVLEHEVESRRDGGGLLQSRSRRDMQNEIESQIMGTYIGNVYKLRAEYYNKSHTVLRDDITFDFTDCKCHEDARDKFFEPYAITDTTKSEIADRRDLFVIGYVIRGSQDDEIVKGLEESNEVVVDQSFDQPADQDMDGWVDESVEQQVEQANEQVEQVEQSVNKSPAPVKPTSKPTPPTPPATRRIIRRV